MMTMTMTMMLTMVILLLVVGGGRIAIFRYYSFTLAMG